MTVHEKTLQELKQECDSVMDNSVISDLTEYTPRNSSLEISESEIMARAERFAPSMHKIMRQLDDVIGGQNDVGSQIAVAFVRSG
jgi:hypothetical protein